MKPIPEAQRFDRTSTREELFQVIELLSAIKRAQGFSTSAQANAGHFDIATEDADTDQAGLSTDDELALVAEIGPLTALEKRELIN